MKEKGIKRRVGNEQEIEWGKWQNTTTKDRSRKEKRWQDKTTEKGRVESRREIRV